MTPEIFAVIGRGYGDEGKGLATDFLSSSGKNPLVIKHNGGAQAGHTVERDGQRFVFHQLSSGSFCHADTYWAATYLPDLYKLPEETEDFYALAGFVPEIYASTDTCITLIDDVLINMAIETKRGEGRHGSCGMGINEADLRTKAGYGITICEVQELSEEALLKKLQRIRMEYVPKRLEQLELTLGEAGKYGNLLEDDTVLVNFCRQIRANSREIRMVEDLKMFLRRYDRVIFESGQGLLLDAECEESMPHVTASRTGITNPLRLLKAVNLKLDEVLYVTRSYLTRHGAGPLEQECAPWELGELERDQTNLTNDWQGNLRYGRFGTVQEFLKPVLEDLNQAPSELRISFLVTHLNETRGMLKFAKEDLLPEEFKGRSAELGLGMHKLHVSGSKYSKDIGTL